MPLLFALTQSLAGQAPIDLLERHLSLGIAGLSGPRLEAARVVVIRSDDEARAFAIAAFGTDKKQLHIDFAKEQVVAICWGTRRVARALLGRGHLPQMPIHRAVIADQTLQIALRTLLPLGKGGEDPEGLVTYPSIFLKTPITRSVSVEVGGARCRDQQTDFQPVEEDGLEVRVLPDSMPARTEVYHGFDDRWPTGVAARVVLEPAANGKRLVIDWGAHPPACYALDVVELRIQDGVAHLAVRAHVFQPGGPVLRTKCVLNLPPVQRVVLRIDRVGALPAGDTRDFVPSAGPELTVEVDRSAAERAVHCLIR
jgi:hypothetical protein